MVSECPLIAMAKNMPRDNPQAQRATVTAMSELCEYYGFQPGMPVGLVEANLAHLEAQHYGDPPDADQTIAGDGGDGDDDSDFMSGR